MLSLPDDHRLIVCSAYGPACKAHGRNAECMTTGHIYNLTHRRGSTVCVDPDVMADHHSQPSAFYYVTPQRCSICFDWFNVIFAWWENPSVVLYLQRKLHKFSSTHTVEDLRDTLNICPDCIDRICHECAKEVKTYGHVLGPDPDDWLKDGK